MFSIFSIVLAYTSTVIIWKDKEVHFSRGLLPMLFNIPYNSIRRRVSIAQFQRLQVLLPALSISYLYGKIGIPGRKDSEFHESFDYLCDNIANK